VEPAVCPVCQRQYDPLRSRAVAVVDGKVRAWCSAECKDKRVPDAVDEPAPRRSRRPLFAVLAVAATALAAIAVKVAERRNGHLATPQPVLMVAPRPVVKIPTTAEAMALLKGTDDGNDVWVHPLYGPKRHMPDRPTRRFGALREGLRPEECEGGHCGVDIGTTRGQPVIAAHDGVIERVERDPNVGGRRGNEGRFIRINHKGGTIVTSYMHLDMIRDDLKPGIPVKMGEEIGTIGDTGVLRSGPHLHFAVSVRANIDSPETFIDPQPLLMLWPVKTAPPTVGGRKTAQAPSGAHGG
jgi:murein DD-endopeptidase MepM/ murein hydrolase activator NlpD